MISNPPTGRVYFFKTDKTIKNKFSPILEINSNFSNNNLNEFQKRNLDINEFNRKII